MDGTRQRQIALAASSTDGQYNGIVIGPVTATIADNDTPAGCVPHPPVRLQSTVVGGQLQVTVQSSLLGTGAANAISEIDLGTLQNARVALNGQTVASGQAVTLPAGTTSVALTVQRATPGQATTVPFTVRDRCGPWPTFVGGGTSAGF